MDHQHQLEKVIGFLTPTELSDAPTATFSLKLTISTHIRCTSRQRWRTIASSSTTNNDGLWPTVPTYSQQACSRMRAPKNAFVKPAHGGRTLAAISRMSMSHFHVLEETQVRQRQEQHWPQPLSCRLCSVSLASWSMLDPTI